MIVLHRLGHDDEPFHLNPDLFQTIEETPDTVITLTTAQKIVVSESPDEVVARIRDLARGHPLGRAGVPSPAPAARGLEALLPSRSEGSARRADYTDDAL